VITLLEKLCSSITRMCGALACMAMILMLFNVFYDVVMRYIFNDVSIGMQELEWHLFAVVFLLGIPYAMQRDGHVRVDIFYDHWPEKRKALINIFGALIFIFPFVILVSCYGFSFAEDSYSMGEGSGDPGGLPHRWIIKSLIPISFLFMGVAGIGMILKAVRVLRGQDRYKHHGAEMLS